MASLDMILSKKLITGTDKSAWMSRLVWAFAVSKPSRQIFSHQICSKCSKILNAFSLSVLVKKKSRNKLGGTRVK